MSFGVTPASRIAAKATSAAASRGGSPIGPDRFWAAPTTQTFRTGLRIASAYVNPRPQGFGGRSEALNPARAFPQPRDGPPLVQALAGGRPEVPGLPRHPRPGSPHRHREAPPRRRRHAVLRGASDLRGPRAPRGRAGWRPREDRRGARRPRRPPPPEPPP